MKVESKDGKGVLDDADEGKICAKMDVKKNGMKVMMNG